MNALKLVNTANMERDDWLDWRRKGIGGSDVAALCGLSKYKSSMHLYLEKMGEIPPIEDNPKMAAGRKLEPLIADWFAEVTGKRIRR